MRKFFVTTDITKLAKTTGFWSKREVVFNQDPDAVVLLDPDLTIKDARRLIEKILQKELNISLRHWIDKGMSPTKTRDFKSMLMKPAALRSTFNLKKSYVFDNPKFKSALVRKKSWLGVYEWLNKTFSTEEEQKTEFVELLTSAVIEAPDFISDSAPGAYIFQLKNKYFQKSLESWELKGLRMKEVVESLISTWSPENLSTIPNQECTDVLNSWSANGLVVPNSQEVTFSKLKAIRCATEVFLGLLRISGKLLFAPNMHMHRLLMQYSAPKEFREKVLIFNTFNTLNTADAKSLTGTIYGASTVENLEDIPENLREMVLSYPCVSNLNRAFTACLSKLSYEHGGKPYQIKGLHGLRAKGGKSRSYTTAWLKELKEIPPAWIKFSETLDIVSHNGQSARRSSIRPTIEWAWFERGFRKPSDITVTDLRDPHNPQRKDTLIAHISGQDIKDYWGKWQLIELSFKRIHNYSKLYENEFLPSNPFASLENPFKSRSSKNKNATHRLRIPNNHHEAMLQVLLSPDEKGMPTFSFVKDSLKWFWFDWENKVTGEVERTWCPSVARCLAFMMMLVPRSKQARWLDQGLLDERIWDVESSAYVENIHELRNWRHPSTGKTHIDTYGRPSGVLQPIMDDYSDQKSGCIFVNTNKTSMWDPDNKIGYELWWPRSDQLLDSDIAQKIDQAKYIDRPYLLIEAQLAWLAKYDPFPVPITFEDVPGDNYNLNEKESYPYFTPLFRDLSSIGHSKSTRRVIFTPAPKGKLERLFCAVAVEAERLLREQGLEAILTVPHKSNPSYKGRKCIYDLHSLRVYGLSYLLEIGVPLTVAQMIMGHASPTMTLHYNKHSSDFVRSVIAGKISSTDILGDWTDIISDGQEGLRKFVVMNSGFRKNHIPHEIIDDADFTGFTSCHGGICIVGGTGCANGEVKEEHRSSRRNTKIEYQPVRGGCGNCRFFATTPAQLFDHQMVINEMMITIRSVGKKQTVIADKLSDLQWENEGNCKVNIEIEGLKTQMEDIERQIEPLVREWLNRVNMAKETINNLDSFISFVREQKGDKGGLMLISPSTCDDVAPEIEFRMEKTGEFELARQTLLAAHMSGGVEQASELSRLQVRNFIDQIMIHDDPKHLLLKIASEKVRDKVAFLLSEAMVATVGPDTVQKALDKNVGLKEIGVGRDEFDDLNILISGVFANAERLDERATFEQLLPTSLSDIKEIVG